MQINQASKLLTGMRVSAASGRETLMELFPTSWLEVFVAEAAAHGMGEHETVGDAVLMIGTLIGWNYLLNLLSFHIPFVERLISGSSVQIVRDGRLIRRNMRREYLTEEELMSQLRRQGIERVEEVKAAFIEGEGQLTVIPRKRPVQ